MSATRFRLEITLIETVAPVVETVALARPHDSTVEPETETEEEIISEEESEEEEDEPVTNVVTLRRAVITEADLTAPPSVLKDVILDDTGKKCQNACGQKRAQASRQSVSTCVSRYLGKSRYDCRGTGSGGAGSRCRCLGIMKSNSLGVSHHLRKAWREHHSDASRSEQVTLM